MQFDCFECHETIAADDLRALGDRFLVHARERHQWPFPDQGIRNYAEATQRLTGPSERVERLGTVTVEPVTAERIDDWLAFFDHDAFVGAPEWAACYCMEPHRPPRAATASDVPHWSENRAAMIERLQHGESFGYLAYVDGRPAAWVNASRLSDEALHCRGPGAEPRDDEVAGVACFVIAPPYRGHGLAGRLLDRVIADASDRGLRYVEAFPFEEGTTPPERNFRGPHALFERRGFVPVETRDREQVVRLELRKR